MHPAVEQGTSDILKRTIYLILCVFFLSQHALYFSNKDTELAETAVTETSPTPNVFQRGQTHLSSLNS